MTKMGNRVLVGSREDKRIMLPLKNKLFEDREIAIVKRPEHVTIWL